MHPDPCCVPVSFFVWGGGGVPPEFMDFSHCLGLDQFSGNQQVKTIFGQSTQEVRCSGLDGWRFAAMLPCCSWEGVCVCVCYVCVCGDGWF